MTEPINEDVRELQRKGDLNKLQDYFNEPHRKEWHVEDLKKLEQIYDLAHQLDQMEPVDALISFDRSYPHNFEIGTERTRLGKMLLALEIYLQNKGSKYTGYRGTKREF